MALWVTRKMRDFLVTSDAEEQRCALDEEERTLGNLDAYDDVLQHAVIRRRDVMGDGIAGEKIAVMPELYRDLEVHRDYAGEKSGSLASVVDRTFLHGSKTFLRSVLDHPVDDVGLLRRRQATLRFLDCAEASSWEPMLREMATYETDVLWMFRYGEDESLRMLYDIPFFHRWFSRCLNRSSWVLTATNLHSMILSPLIGLLSPICYFVVPFFILRLKFGLTIPFSQYLTLLWRSAVVANDLIMLPASMRWAKYVSCFFSMAFYFQSVFTSFEVSSTLRKVCRSLSTRTSRVSRFFHLSAKLHDALWTEELARSWFPALSVDASVPQRPAMSAGAAGHDIRPFSLGSFGADLKAFRTFDPAAAARLMQRTYGLDAAISIVAARRELGASWTTFDESAAGGPRLELTGVWHPGLPAERAVTNDWHLGVGGAKHALLTGPNAGGKSTLLKAALISVLLSQTLTIAPCKGGCTITPFRIISSHINVPDAQGRESLFEAEMHRSKRNLDALRGLPAGRFALVVMDEIFSSTNPVEGIAGAFAVAKRIASHPGVVSIISTHYLYLCKLEQETGGSVTNFRMPVATQDQTPYRLKRGISRQYVALELLRKSGFDDQLIADAIQVKRNLLHGGRRRRGGGDNKPATHKKPSSPIPPKQRPSAKGWIS